jgi:HrpA-like RNA helicase
MAKLPLEPLLSKMLLTSTEPDFDCTKEMLSIVSLQAAEAESSLFFAPKNKREDANAAKRRMAVKDGDHLTLLSIFERYE